MFKCLLEPLWVKDLMTKPNQPQVHPVTRTFVWTELELIGSQKEQQSLVPHVCPAAECESGLGEDIDSTLRGFFLNDDNKKVE